MKGNSNKKWTLKKTNRLKKGGQKDWRRYCDLLRERSSCHFGILKSQRLRASKLKGWRPPFIYNPLPAHRTRVGSQARMDLHNTTWVWIVILVGTALLTPDWCQTMHYHFIKWQRLGLTAFLMTQLNKRSFDFIQELSHTEWLFPATWYPV